MSRQRSASLIVILLCLALAGCRTPGDTVTDYTLQGDIQAIINANELAHGHWFGGRVVDTKFVSEAEGTVTEHWYVKRGSHEVIYTVNLTPSPDGGTYFKVELPEEEDRPQATQLPQTFENIWYRPKKRGFSLLAFTDKGMLTIGKDALEFTSKKKQLAVPYSSVLEVRWEKVGVDLVNSWAVVRFDAEGSEGFAAFKDGKALGWGGESDEIYIKLKQAFADFSSPTGRPGLSVSIDEQTGPQSFREPNVPVAGGEDAEIVSAVEAAVSVASKLGFRSDASESAHGRVVVQALWHGRPVTLTMRFFRRAESAQYEGGIYIASSLTRPENVAASGGGQKIERLYYSRLSEEEARRGLRIYGDPTARP